MCSLQCLWPTGSSLGHDSKLEIPREQPGEEPETEKVHEAIFTKSNEPVDFDVSDLSADEVSKSNDKPREVIFCVPLVSLFGTNIQIVLM